MLAIQITDSDIFVGSCDLNINKYEKGWQIELANWSFDPFSQ